MGVPTWPPQRPANKPTKVRRSRLLPLQEKTPWREAQAQRTSCAPCSRPETSWAARGQPAVALAFQGPAWHAGNVPAKALPFGEAREGEAILDRGFRRREPPLEGGELGS